jgi:hypothetical protein
MTTLQKPIGGFFELELTAKGSLYHDSALALVNGRVCFKVLLERVKPTKIYLPFYCCDSLLLPLEEARIPYEFYGINAKFDPTIPLIHDSEMILYINYFGLKTLTANKLSKLYGGQLIVDNTQAFFEKSYGVTWAFNSARKFFGVPDGGFLYAPQYIEDKYLPNREVLAEHLWLRLFGKQEEAFMSYQQSEALQTLELKGISNLSKQILHNVDFSAVARTRKRHFKRLDHALRHLNQIPHVLLDLSPSTVPFCYPLLLEKPVSKTEFYDCGIFIPTLWQDVLSRDTEGSYAFEKSFSQNLLPLPIDHRLDDRDIQRMVDFVLSIV